MIFYLYLVDPLPDWLRDVDARVQSGLQFGQRQGFILPGDPVIVITGWRQGSGFTNNMRVVYVSEQGKGFLGLL